MKFAALIIAALVSAVTATVAPVTLTADSALGQNLLSHARRLDQNDNEWINFNWVSGYAVKFQGCHHIKQWNEEADGEEDVRIQTQRLIRFRLCPDDSCSATKAAGCTQGYGDYIIDMDTFMQSYIEAKKQKLEYECEYAENYVCNCDGDEYCLYDCYVAKGLDGCIENNPYNENDEEEQFELEEFMECQQVDVNNDNGYGGGGYNAYGEEIEYFVGPYCAMQGGSVYLGLFTDDTCTEFAEGVSYRQLTGMDLPFDGVSLVDEECMSCLEQQDNDENQNDQQDEDNVSENCEMLYQGAGKCEVNLPEGMVYYPNNNACNYMEGIRVVRQDGIVDTGASRSSAVATAFIVIFAMAFAAMAFYVWYLRTRLGVKQNTLL